MLIQMYIILYITQWNQIWCLQCFDTVGWASGRAFRLWNRVMGCWCGYLSGARCRLFAYGPADATATPKPHHLLPHLNPDLFYLSGTGLPSILLLYIHWNCQWNFRILLHYSEQFHVDWSAVTVSQLCRQNQHSNSCLHKLHATILNLHHTYWEHANWSNVWTDFN